MTSQDYINLVITSEYIEQPNFVAVCGFNANPYIQIQALLSSMIQLFDLATPPVGNQLDIIGKWVGIQRQVKLPITNVFFTWDSTAAIGWDGGSWAPVDSPYNLVSLPDDAYLLVIKAKIASNNWDGTTEGAYTIWNNLFSNLTILIQDYNDMSFALVVVGTISALNLALITGGYIPLRSEGVLMKEFFVSNTGPVFAWDVNSTLLQGWDYGKWATELPPT